MSYTDVKNLPSTVKTLIRSHGEGRIRNQSFSTSTKSKRVKLDMVDHRMLRMRTDADKITKHAETKRMNNVNPFVMLDRIEFKINDLLRKLEKAIRHQTDTTALDALLVRCRYYRHRELVRLAELQVRGDEREAEIAKVMLPTEAIPVFDKPIIPASVGRVYKVKRKVLKDRPGKLGEAKGRTKGTSQGGATIDELVLRGIRKTHKRINRKLTAKRGAGSY